MCCGTCTQHRIGSSGRWGATRSGIQQCFRTQPAAAFHIFSLTGLAVHELVQKVGTHLCISKWSGMRLYQNVMTFAGRLRRAPLTECFKNEICFTWVPNSGSKIFVFDESRCFFRTSHLAIGPWLVLTSFSTDYCLTCQMRSKPVTDQSEMSCVKKYIDFGWKSKNFIDY